MPHRLNEFRAKIQFTSSARTPSLVRKAAKATGKPSNTVYLQHAVARALSRDLGIDYQELLDELPPPRGPASSLFGRSERAAEGCHEPEGAL